MVAECGVSIVPLVVNAPGSSDAAVKILIAVDALVRLVAVSLAGAADCNEP